MDFREIKEFFRDISLYVISFAIILIIFVFIVSFQPIAGNSMTPTIEEGDVVLVSKLSYMFSDIERNDIVTLKINKKSYVKRVIGLPGENIAYLKNILYINGEAYKENFLEEDIETSGFTFEDICSKEKCPEQVIPNDMYLVMGDNRPESEDSRTPEFGLVKKSNIKGKVFLRIWPINKIGTVK